jgi:hypothetical protein
MSYKILLIVVSSLVKVFFTKTLCRSTSESAGLLTWRDSCIALLETASAKLKLKASTMQFLQSIPQQLQKGETASLRLTLLVSLPEISKRLNELANTQMGGESTANALHAALASALWFDIIPCDHSGNTSRGKGYDSTRALCVMITRLLSALSSWQPSKKAGSPPF